MKWDSIVFSASITRAWFSANKILIKSFSSNSFKNNSKPIPLETNDISRIVACRGYFLSDADQILIIFDNSNLTSCYNFWKK